jgi:predicted GIY-YIG superfamily endonuclease
MHIVSVEKIINVKLLKKLTESFCIEKNEPLEIKKTIIEEYDTYELEVYHKDNKIGFIDDYWADINIGNAIELNAIKQCNFSERFSGFIKVKILLEAELNEDLYKSLETLAGIYGIIDRDSGNIYVGQTSNIKNRIKNHFTNLSLGFHHNTNLQELFIEKKESVFEIAILEKFNGKYLGGIQDRTWLEKAEKRWIQHFRNLGKCLNKTKGEFIETKKTRQEKFEIELLEKEKKAITDRAHDLRISEQKRILKDKMGILEEKMKKELLRLQPLYDEQENVRKWILENSSWLDFLKSKKIKDEKRKKKELLESLESTLNNEESIYDDCYREMKVLKAELKKLKTSKQLNYHSKLQKDKVMRYVRGY